MRISAGIWRTMPAPTPGPTLRIIQRPLLTKCLNEYSPRWNGPMIYDSINVYSEVQERYGRLHRALTRAAGFYALGQQVARVGWAFRRRAFKSFSTRGTRSNFQ